MQIRFGAWSTGLGVAVALVLLVAARLAFTGRNAVANRWLAALLALLALRVVVYVIGYAGFYDAYPWLSYAPLDLALWYGPLLWVYVVRLTTGSHPPAWRWHLLPGLLQFAYQTAVFVQPLAFKEAWDARLHGPFVEPFEQLATAVSVATYLFLAASAARAYGAWLEAHVSDRDAHRRPWLWIAVGGLATVLVVQVAFELTDRLVVDLDYFDRFPEYVAYAALVVLLALEAWRYAEHPFPIASTSPSSQPVSDGTSTRVVAPPEPAVWERQAEAWAARIEREGWWREPQLSLADVAHRLGTNENYLSRALNERLGQGFNEFVNRLRVRAVQAALDAGAEQDLLALGLDAGFGSKASFNRAFRTYAGLTPAEYRARRRPT